MLMPTAATAAAAGKAASAALGAVAFAPTESTLASNASPPTSVALAPPIALASEPTSKSK